jgi:phosphate-selective porin OprO/OprP
MKYSFVRALAARLSVVLVLLSSALAAAQPAPEAPVAPVPDAPPPPPPPPPSLTKAEVDAIVEARLAALPPPPPVPEPPAGWNNGFWITSPRFKLRIGAVIQFDGRFFVDEGSDNTHVDTFAFRSTRLDLGGTVWDHWDIRLVPDFAGSKLVVQDAYIDAHYAEGLKLRFGKFKVPFGLERLQDERNTQFTERGLPTQLAPNRDLGVEAFGELGGGALSYQAGVFNGVADGGNSDGDASDDKDFAGRVFVKPVPAYEIGFGGAATVGEQHGHVATNTDVGSFKTPGQTTFFQFGPNVTANGLHWRATGQAYAYPGPFQLFAEYVRSQQHVLDGTKAEVAQLEAWQLLVSIVLTGEKASYKGVTPDHPFDPSKGTWGAFDVAARIGELRVVDAGTLNDGFADPTKSARRIWSGGVGTSWYPNRTIRFMLDVERSVYTRGAMTGDRPPETTIIGRAQAAF